MSVPLACSTDHWHFLVATALARTVIPSKKDDNCPANAKPLGWIELVSEADYAHC